MHVVSFKALREFIKDHPDSKVPLNRWYIRMKKGTFKSQHELKKTYSGLDYIGNERYVFNISGNKYRLVAVIFISSQIVFVRFIGTHAEYDRIDVTII
jgi:mRNA interferase HigB